MWLGQCPPLVTPKPIVLLHEFCLWSVIESCVSNYVVSGIDKDSPVKKLKFTLCSSKATGKLDLSVMAVELSF